MIGYYDYVLALIPTALLGVTGLLTLIGLPLLTALSVGGGASTLVVAHALFVNGPAGGDGSAGSASTAPRSGSPPPNAD